MHSGLYDSIYEIGTLQELICSRDLKRGLKYYSEDLAAAFENVISNIDLLVKESNPQVSSSYYFAEEEDDEESSQLSEVAYAVYDLLDEAAECGFLCKTYYLLLQELRQFITQLIENNKISGSEDVDDSLALLEDMEQYFNSAYQDQQSQSYGGSSSAGRFGFGMVSIPKSLDDEAKDKQMDIQNERERNGQKNMIGLYVYLTIEDCFGHLRDEVYRVFNADGFAEEVQQTHSRNILDRRNEFVERIQARLRDGAGYMYNPRMIERYIKKLELWNNGTIDVDNPQGMVPLAIYKILKEKSTKDNRISAVQIQQILKEDYNLVVKAKRTITRILRTLSVDNRYTPEICAELDVERSCLKDGFWFEKDAVNNDAYI